MHRSQVMHSPSLWTAATTTLPNLRLALQFGEQPELHGHERALSASNPESTLPNICASRDSLLTKSCWDGDVVL